MALSKAQKKAFDDAYQLEPQISMCFEGPLAAIQQVYASGANFMFDFAAIRQIQIALRDAPVGTSLALVGGSVADLHEQMMLYGIITGAARSFLHCQLDIEPWSDDDDQQVAEDVVSRTLEYLCEVYTPEAMSPSFDQWMKKPAEPKFLITRGANTE